jgi:glycosyltransferase involved in cell wall biosynthesis
MSDRKRRQIQTLVPMALDGVGPSFSAVKLAEGVHAAGLPVTLYVNRRRMEPPAVPLRVALPGVLSRLPYKRIAETASHLIEARFERALGEGDIAWLWPSASLDLQKRVRARGNPVVLEGINTRMAHARAILDAAYADFGLEASHGITQARIDEEEEKIALADAIFAPSRAVETALAGTALAERFIPTSYGVDLRKARGPRHYDTGRPPVFLFCGYACIRKGVHHLLDAWRRMPGDAKLRLVGRIEPILAERYADVLKSDRVECVGFVKDVHLHFAAADIFLLPSLEEGDPLVTYEAALHGLPIIASPMGGGRMGDTPGRMVLVEPGDVEGLLNAMQSLADTPDRRATLGSAVRAAVEEHDWLKVGARRGKALFRQFGKV